MAAEDLTIANCTMLQVRVDDEIKTRASGALAAMGRRNLERARITGVTLATGDGARGFGTGEYDAIVLTGSTPRLDDAFLRQLKPGGRVFAVVGEAPVMTARILRWVGTGSVVANDRFETVIAPLRNVATPSRFVL